MTGFSVWAPAAGRVDVEVAGQRYPMSLEKASTESGWWSADVPDVAAGIDYGFRLDNGELLPDPRSPRQPFGIKGPSRTLIIPPSGGPTAAGGAARCTAR